MAVRLAIHNGFRVVHECNDKCHSAKKSKCACICGGVMHSISYRKRLSEIDQECLEFLATMNLQLYADAMADSFMGFKQQSQYRVVTGFMPEQLQMFD